MGKAVFSRFSLLGMFPGRVFLTIFEVFHLVMKHCVESFILLLKQNESSDFQTLVKHNQPLYFLF